MNLVHVSGISMRPLLIDGDLVEVRPIPNQINFGSLVLATNIYDEKIVHRYLGPNKVKGDRVKQWDNLKSIDMLVTKRISVTSLKKKSLENRIENTLLGIISYLNNDKYTVINHMAAGLVEILGRIQRK